MVIGGHEDSSSLCDSHIRCYDEDDGKLDRSEDTRRSVCVCVWVCVGVCVCVLVCFHNNIIVYRIAGHFRGRKLSRISLFRAYQRKFSKRSFKGLVDTVGTSEQSTKFSLRNYVLPPIRISFLPRKILYCTFKTKPPNFPAIQFIYTYISYYECHLL